MDTQARADASSILAGIRDVIERANCMRSERVGDAAVVAAEVSWRLQELANELELILDTEEA